MDDRLPLDGPDFKTRVLTVLWPAFMMAGVLEMLVFALVDPQQLHGWGADASAWPRGAVYTLAFFVFWLAIALASALSLWLATPDRRSGD
jgi:hypothetical protein